MLMNVDVLKRKSLCLQVALAEYFAFSRQKLTNTAI